jgi:hypothetical protein
METIEYNQTRSLSHHLSISLASEVYIQINRQSYTEHHEPL